MKRVEMRVKFRTLALSSDVFSKAHMMRAKLEVAAGGVRIPSYAVIDTALELLLNVFERNKSETAADVLRHVHEGSPTEGKPGETKNAKHNR